MSLKVNTEIKKMVSNIIDRNYKKASDNLSNIIDKKMEQKIINNNIKAF
jgi:hypothetical protein